MEALQIKVGADLSGASKAFAKLEKDIAAAMAGGEASFKKFVQSYQQTSTKVGQAVQKTGKDFTGLSRVLQDLPFGFTAIQNNLTQLVPAAGAAGLAFSALVAGLTFAQTGLQNWIRGTKGTSEAVKELQKDTAAFAASLKEAEAGALATGASLQAYVNIAKDGKKPLEERNLALKEANKILGEHGEKLTLVNINTQAVTDAVNMFTQALIQQALAAKFADRVADLLIKQQEAAKEYGVSMEGLAKAREKFNRDSNVTTMDSEGDFLRTAAAGNKLNNAYDKAAGSATKYKTVTAELQDIMGLLNKSTGTATELFAKLGTKPPDVKKVKEKIKKDLKEDPIDIPPLRFDVIPYVRPELVGKVSATGNSILNKLLADQKKFLDEQQARAQLLADTIGSVVTPAFTGMFDALADGKNVLNSFFNGIAQGLKSLLSRMAAALAQALALKAVFSLIPGLGSIGGITSGMNIGSIFGKLLGFADGGVVFGPTAALIGEGRGTSRSNPEIVAPLDKLKGYIQGAGGGGYHLSVSELRLSGNDLIAAIEVNQRSQRRRY